MIGTVVQHLPCFKDLIAVLIECFLIITLGYLSCRFKLISTQAKDLNLYLTTFALPMIIFLNIAQMRFETINVSFLLCMLTSKLLVFILVTILTLAISYPTNFGYAGALSILATQSNDFALGYPLIKSLYGDTRSEMLDYLNLMAPIQLLILNPLGIVMLEYQKSRKMNNCQRLHNNSQDDDDDDDSDNHEDNEEYDNVDYDLKIRDNNDNNKLSSLCNCEINKNEIINCRRAYEKQKFCSVSDENCVDDNDIIDQNGTRLGEQHIRRRLSISSDKILSGCSKAINSDSIKNSSSSSSSKTPISKVVCNKNIKALKLIIPSMENILPVKSESPNSNSSSDQSIVGKLQSSDYNLKQTSCCYCEHKCIGGNIDRKRASQNNIIASICKGSGSSISNGNNIKSPTTTTAINLNFLKALATNPLIIASVVALAVNLTYGPKLPKFVTKVSSTIAASFAAPALFVVGLSMYGKFELLIRNPNDLLLSSVLVLTKIILLPSLMRTLALIFLPAHTPAEEIPYLIDFSYLYGLLPTAPTACIIAKQYGVLTNVVSISMLLSIFISAPLMLAASVIINPASVIRLTDIQYIIGQTLKVSSFITLILASIALYAFWKSRKHLNYNKFINLPLEITCSQITSKIKTNPTHIFLFLLAITQIMIGLGGLSWYFVDSIKIDPTLQLIQPSQYHNQQHGIIKSNIPIKNLSSIISNTKLSNNNDNGNGNNNNNNNVLVESEPIPMDLPAPIPVNSNIETLIEEDTSEGDTSFSDSDSSLKQKETNNLPISLKSMPTQSASSQSNALVNNNKFNRNNHNKNVYDNENNNNSIGFESISVIQYVLASSGILLARFVILCILITTASIRYKGYIMATKVSSIMVKSFLVLSLILIIWLIFDSKQAEQQQAHFPVESTIPNKEDSLYIRLVYNSLFIIIAVPLFAMIIRLDNRTKKLLQIKRKSLLLDKHNQDQLIIDDDDQDQDGDDEPIVVCDENNANESNSTIGQLKTTKKRNFATSNVSLSSDTSSALTTNTNLESSPSNVAIHDVNNNNNGNSNNNNQQQQNSQHHRTTQLHNIDSISVLIENVSPNNNNINIINNESVSSNRVLNSILANHNNDLNTIDISNSVQISCNQFNVNSYNAANSIHQQHSSTTTSSLATIIHDRNGRIFEKQKSKLVAGLLQMSEFNKYSILILFMLITTTLNLTSIIQKIVQEKPFGTFRQIEIMGVALEFGQGLLTFLIYGVKGLFN